METLSTEAVNAFNRVAGSPKDEANLPENMTAVHNSIKFSSLRPEATEDQNPHAEPVAKSQPAGIATATMIPLVAERWY
jgi:hypothetical protein